MILTKNSLPQEKTQILRPSHALKVSSEQTNPEVLRPWYSIQYLIFKSATFSIVKHFQAYRFIRIQTIYLVRLLFAIKCARSNCPSI